MRLLFLAAAIGLLSAAWYLGGDLMRPHDVYRGPVAQVHDTLATMVIPSSQDGPLGAHPVTKTSDKPLALSWTGGPRGAITCTATLEAVTVATTRAIVGCTADTDTIRDRGAVLALARIAMTEQVDSTLRGRPYNKQAVAIGASAVAALGAVPPPNRGGAPSAPSVGAAPPADSPDAPLGAAPASTPAPPANNPVIPATPVG